MEPRRERRRQHRAVHQSLVPAELLVRGRRPHHLDPGVALDRRRRRAHLRLLHDRRADDSVPMQAGLPEQALIQRMARADAARLRNAESLSAVPSGRRSARDANVHRWMPLVPRSSMRHWPRLAYGAIDTDHLPTTCLRERLAEPAIRETSVASAMPITETVTPRDVSKLRIGVTDACPTARAVDRINPYLSELSAADIGHAFGERRRASSCANPPISCKGRLRRRRA